MMCDYLYDQMVDKHDLLYVSNVRTGIFDSFHAYSSACVCVCVCVCVYLFDRLWPFLCLSLWVSVSGYISVTTESCQKSVFISHQMAVLSFALTFIRNIQCVYINCM